MKDPHYWELRCIAAERERDRARCERDEARAMLEAANDKLAEIGRRWDDLQRERDEELVILEGRNIELNAMALKLAAVEKERDEARAERDRDLADMRRFQKLYMESDHARREAEAKLARIAKFARVPIPTTALPLAVEEILAIARGERRNNG